MFPKMTPVSVDETLIFAQICLRVLVQAHSSVAVLLASNHPLLQILHIGFARSLWFDSESYHPERYHTDGL